MYFNFYSKLTALHVAADHGNSEIIEVLIKANVDVSSELLDFLYPTSPIHCLPRFFGMTSILNLIILL